MKQKKEQILVVVILSLMFTGLCCCNGKTAKNSQDIKGIWAAITNDSIYEEIIITDTTFYLYDERGGDVSMTYKIENDSLKIFYNKVLQSARQFKRINADEFIEQDEQFKVRFQRIKVYGDTARILRIDEISSDEEYFFNYVQELRYRRCVWDSLRRNKGR
jgi:hypothetical protein